MSQKRLHLWPLFVRHTCQNAAGLDDWQNAASCFTSFGQSAESAVFLHVYLWPTHQIRRAQMVLHTGFEDFKGVRPPTRYEVLDRHKLPILLWKLYCFFAHVFLWGFTPQHLRISAKFSEIGIYNTSVYILHRCELVYWLSSPVCITGTGRTFVPFFHGRVWCCIPILSEGVTPCLVLASGIQLTLQVAFWCFLHTATNTA